MPVENGRIAPFTGSKFPPPLIIRAVLSVCMKTAPVRPRRRKKVLGRLGPEEGPGKERKNPMRTVDNTHQKKHVTYGLKLIAQAQAAGKVLSGDLRRKNKN